MEHHSFSTAKPPSVRGHRNAEQRQMALTLLQEMSRWRGDHLMSVWARPPSITDLVVPLDGYLYKIWLIV